MSDQQPTPCPDNRAQQSPINLRSAFVTDFGRNALVIKWNGMAQGHLNSDDGVKITFGFDSRLFVTLDTRQYFLTQFHFHHPSEHAVNEKQKAVELHAVHQNLDDGKLVVVGIFIEIGTDEAQAPPLASHLASLLKGGKSQDEHPAVSLNPADYLPSNSKQYYRYEGSLTTPPFSENVSWAILRESRYISKQELSTLIQHVRHPARLPQPLNRRFVLANFKD